MSKRWERYWISVTMDGQLAILDCVTKSPGNGAKGSDDLQSSQAVFAIRELARLPRSEAIEMVQMQAERKGFSDPVPGHVIAALLTMALGEPPLERISLDHL